MAKPRTIVDEVDALHTELSAPTVTGGDALVRMLALRQKDPDAFDQAMSKRLGMAEKVTSDARSIGTAVSGAEALDFKIESGVTWHTHECIRTLKPRWYCLPDSLKDLQALVHTAMAKKRRVRAFGSGHSYSDVALCDEYFVDTSLLQKELPFRALKAGVDKSELVHVEAGIKLHNLNDLLDGQGRAMINLGGYTGQSIIGAMSTATHGSGLEIGNLASLIVSFVIVTEIGTFRIEREDGPTNPDGWQEAGVDKLLQDNQVFNAMAVGLGCFGLIYSVMMKVRTAYLLEERRIVTTWSKVAPSLRSGAIFKDAKTGKNHRHVEVLVNPHSTHGDHTALLTIRDEVKSAPEGVATSRDWVSQFLKQSRALLSITIGIMNTFPHLVPGFFDSTIQSWAVDRLVAPSVTVLASNKAPNGYACENAVKMDGDRHVRATEAIFAFAAREAKAHKRYLSMTALRFVKATDIFLAAQEDAAGIPSCHYETITPTGLAGAPELFAGVTREMFAFGGRPHWGLEWDVLSGLKQVKGLYPKMDAWLEVRKRFCPHGTFDNAFTKRIGIST